jgi:hypothetical protein
MTLIGLVAIEFEDGLATADAGLGGRVLARRTLPVTAPAALLVGRMGGFLLVVPKGANED